MDDNNVQNSLCITSMKQELSGPTEAHGPFIVERRISVGPSEDCPAVVVGTGGASVGHPLGGPQGW